MKNNDLTCELMNMEWTQFKVKQEKGRLIEYEFFKKISFQNSLVVGTKFWWTTPSLQAMSGGQSGQLIGQPAGIFLSHFLNDNPDI